MNYVVNFKEVCVKDIAKVGGKNASLGEMISAFSSLHINVPKGFAITTDAYRDFIHKNNLAEKILDKMRVVDIENLTQLRETSQSIQAMILAASFSIEFEAAVTKAFHDLKLKATQSVAVRSSATAEDLEDASFAGLQSSFLNVSGIDNILEAVKKVYASLFTERSISYRVYHHFDETQVAMSVGIQQMIRSDLAASGVMFTLDTESGFDQVVFINASYGLGEGIVGGIVTPDEFYVFKPAILEDRPGILSRKLGHKVTKVIYSNQKGKTVETVSVNEKDQQQFSLTDEDILQLAKKGLLIEKHYGKPMDIEWAKDGEDGELYILQARPETVKRHQETNVLETYQLKEKAKPIVSGRSVGQKIGTGVARYIQNLSELSDFQEGDVLIADITDPDWEPIMRRASAIVTNRGGRTCHAAIVAREMGTPAIVGCLNATEIIKSGMMVTVSCAEGETGYVYPGKLAYSIDKTTLSDLPKLSVKLYVNLSNPEHAFSHHFLPVEGVGLARIEFIISNTISVHPNAILQFDSLPNDLKSTIAKRTAAYASPKEFYIEKLAEGIATISAALYPKPVIVRFSDFKSNEYANLPGGELYEPQEENPMLGYRGGSRYLSESFRDCFAMECEAIKRVRNQKGLLNTHVMFPFVRTVDEAKKLSELIQKNGLIRGENGLKTYMMCEIPSNVILAEEFLTFFDGFSIGSNDLTQLTLGLDRDSALVADTFDERNPAVKALLKHVIQICRQQHKYIGICGQAPSDHPDFAEWLMQEGIETISVTPDTVIKTIAVLSNNKNGAKNACET